MSPLQIAAYFAIAFFVVTISAKMIRIARMPVHLRWDLYPVPHEGRRSRYGGSYYEDINWWTKPRRFSIVADLKEVAREIIFIQSLFRHNRSLWFFSFPFHLGMYCLIALGTILTIRAIWGGINNAAMSSPAGLASIVHHLTIMLGLVGWILGIFGAAGLFFSRIVNPRLRSASNRSDYFNLILLLTIFISGLVSHLTADQVYGTLQNFIASTVRFQPANPLPTAVTAELWFIVVMMFYLPLTHMTHFIGKYFTYHRVRWEDHPNLRGSAIERAVADSLGREMTWQAPHIKTGSSWADAASEDSPRDAT